MKISDFAGPAFTSVKISSNNPNDPKYASVGQQVTLEFSLSKAVTVTSLLISGRSISNVVGSGTGPFTAQTTLRSDDNEGLVQFSISCFSVKNTTANSVTTTATTDGSSVILGMILEYNFIMVFYFFNLIERMFVEWMNEWEFMNFDFLIYIF